MDRPFARGPVLGIGAVTGLVLLAVSGRYGYHRDELYFLAAGRHLAWGYPDQPPLTPLLARLMSSLAPHSLVLLRLPSTLSAAGVVVLTGLLAGELGARRSGQALAAARAVVPPARLICCVKHSRNAKRHGPSSTGNPAVEPDA